MFGSGVPTAEKPQAKKFYLLTYGSEANEQHAEAWKNYKNYLEKTSILIPLPPIIYQHIPTILKRTILLDFSFYQFDEGKDGAAARDEERRNQ